MNLTLLNINTIKNWLDAKLFALKNTRNQINNMNLQRTKSKDQLVFRHCMDTDRKGEPWYSLMRRTSIYTTSKQVDLLFVQFILVQLVFVQS